MSNIRVDQPGGAGTLLADGQIEKGVRCYLSGIDITVTSWTLTAVPVGSTATAKLHPVRGWYFDPDVAGGGYTARATTSGDPYESTFSVAIRAPAPGNTGDEYFVQTLAALRHRLPLQTNETVELLCRSSDGDRGGGHFFWDAASVETDNGGTIVQVTGQVIGRWKRIYEGALNVMWFGARGTGLSPDFNDAAPIQALLDWLASEGISARVYFPKPPQYYRLTSQLVVNGSSSRTVWLEGELSYVETGLGGTRLDFGGAIGTKGVIDIIGGQGVRISNFDIHCQARAMYGIWIRPKQDAPAIGAHNILLEHLHLFTPQDVDGAACVAIGPESGTPTQASEIYISHCYFTGSSAAPAYLAAGVRNIAAGNAKAVYLSDCGFNGFRWAMDLRATSGPVTMIGCGISTCHLAGINVSSGTVSCIGLNFETNTRDCKLLVGSQGSGDGSVSFQGCELTYNDGSLGTKTNDVMVEWRGGALAFRDCLINCVRSVDITGCTGNGVSPIVLTVAAGHGVVAGKRIQVSGVGGNTEANTADGAYGNVTAVGATTITISGTGNGDYTSGGLINFEPEMKIGAPATDTAKAGVVSEQNTWHNCADNLPVFDFTTGFRLLDSARAQALPVPVYSRGDVGYQPGRTQPNKLKTTFGEAFRVASFGAGVLGCDATGLVSSAPQQTYTVANPTTDRALDVTGDTLAQVAAVLGSLIADLQTAKVIK